MYNILLMSAEDLNIHDNGPGIMRLAANEAKRRGIFVPTVALDLDINMLEVRQDIDDIHIINIDPEEIARRQRMLEFISPALGKLFETEGQFGMPGPCMIFPDEDPEQR
jgi:hypothetical protein